MRDLEHGTLADLRTLMGQPPWPRRGNWQLVKPPSPAAGAGYTYAVNPAWWERIINVNATIATAGTAGLRTVSLQLADGDGYVFSTVPLIRGVPGSATVAGQASKELAPAAVPGASVAANGSVTDPAAFASICQVTGLAAGTYQVTATVYLSGTVTSADANNMSIGGAGFGALVVMYPGVANTPVTYTASIDVGAGATVGLQTLAAASGAAAVYNADMVITPVQLGPCTAKLPDLILKPGWTASLAITNANAADQLSAIGIMTERYSSDWASGALRADAEEQLRDFLAWQAERGQGM
jgi:hypothetical protein